MIFFLEGPFLYLPVNYFKGVACYPSLIPFFHYNFKLLSAPHDPLSSIFRQPHGPPFRFFPH